MSGMDRPTDEVRASDETLQSWAALPESCLFSSIARELLAHRRASQAAPAPSEPVTLTYTNWQGKTAQRTITPVRVWFGSTPWHPEPQWLLTAVDAEKGLERDFALKDFGAPAPSDGLREALSDMVALFSADGCLLKGTHLNATLSRARAALRRAAPTEGEA